MYKFKQVKLELTRNNVTLHKLTKNTPPSPLNLQMKQSHVKPLSHYLPLNTSDNYMYYILIYLYDA